MLKNTDICFCRRYRCGRARCGILGFPASGRIPGNRAGRNARWLPPGWPKTCKRWRARRGRCHEIPGKGRGQVERQVSELDSRTEGPRRLRRDIDSPLWTAAL